MLDYNSRLKLVFQLLSFACILICIYGRGVGNICFSKNEVIKKLNLSLTSKKILFVGKLIDKKRPLDILKSLKLIPKDDFEIELLIVNHIFLRGGFKRLAQRGVVRKRCHLGFDSRDICVGDD